jgi:hypothetical protein
MKKIYALTMLAIALLGLVNVGFAQTYTAVDNGNWGDASNWDINGKPPAVVNNGHITINSGVTLVLNTSVELRGTTVLEIKPNAGIYVPFSSTVQSDPHFAIIMYYGEPSNVVLDAATSKIDNTSGGLYDGVILRVPFPTANPPYIDVQRVGWQSTGWNQKIITGPSTLNSVGTLPVYLSRFEAVLNNDVVNLSWTTEQEINSDRFEVQRSSDAAHWSTIGTVAAKGFSSIQADYSFTDESPSSGVNYYRLHIVDRDGKFENSPIRVVRGSVINGFKVFPNPAKDFVYVTLGSDASAQLSIRLVSLQGQVLQEARFVKAAGTTISLPVSNYAKGTYLLQIIGENGVTKTSKLFISNR